MCTQRLLVLAVVLFIVPAAPPGVAPAAAAQETAPSQPTSRQSLDLSELPAPAAHVISRHTRASSNLAISKVRIRQQDAYLALYTTPGGRHMRLVVDDAGKVLEKTRVEKPKDDR